MIEEAKVAGVNLPISLKESVEICNFIRNRNIKKVKGILNNVLKKKVAIPYKRFNQDTPHRRGNIASGRYPVKAVGYFLELLNSLEANAENKGLNVDKLSLSFAVANKGERTWHYGRQKRRRTKRTHLELRAIEKEIKEKKERTIKKK